MSAGAGPTLPPGEAANRCRHLRTKRYYYGTTEEVMEASELSTTAQFWCLRTMRVVGPDQGPVTPQTCRSGRGCCDPVEL